MKIFKLISVKMKMMIMTDNSYNKNHKLLKYYISNLKIFFPKIINGIKITIYLQMNIFLYLYFNYYIIYIYFFIIYMLYI